MGVSLFGDWDRLGSKLSSLPKDLQDAYDEATEETGKLIAETVKGHIYNQDLGHTPLQTNTAIKKGSSDILIETGALVSSIETVKVSKGKVFVGATENTQHPSGESASDLLKYHEFGTDRVPPRPVIRPTYEETKPQAKEILKKHIMEAIRK